MLAASSAAPVDAQNAVGCRRASYVWAGERPMANASGRAIDRRAVIFGGLAALAAPRAAEAQQAGKVARVGVLMNLYSPDAEPPQAFRQGLRGLGYFEGQNLIIDWRYQLGRSDRLPAFAAELISLKPDVLVADVTAAIRGPCRPPGPFRL